MTGAGRGIGRSIALRLAKRGVTVVALARSTVQLDETVKLAAALGGTVTPLPADLSEVGNLPEVVEIAQGLHGPITIAVNNAATVSPLGPVADIDWEEARAALALNVLAPAIIAARLVPGMVDGGWGRIVNVSSRIVAQPGSMVGGNVYAATKAALEAHTLNLAAEIDGSGVTANVYRPGSVDTAMQGFIRAQNPEAIGGGTVERFRSNAEKGSLITPEHSASVLVTLLGTDGNGEVWDVAGDPH